MGDFPSMMNTTDSESLINFNSLVMTSYEIWSSWAVPQHLGHKTEFKLDRNSLFKKKENGKQNGNVKNEKSKKCYKKLKNYKFILSQKFFSNIPPSPSQQK